MIDVDVFPSDTSWLSEPTTGVHQFGGGSIVASNPVTIPFDHDREGALFRVANGPERLVERLKDATATAKPAASLVVGAINAKGASIGFDTSSNITVDPAANLSAQSISLGATAIAFTQGSAPAGTVVFTPAVAGRAEPGRPSHAAFANLDRFRRRRLSVRLGHARCEDPGFA